MGILETSGFPGEAGGMWVHVSYAACLPSTSASPCPINEYLTLKVLPALRLKSGSLPGLLTTECLHRRQSV